MKLTKNKVIAASAIILILIVAFFSGTKPKVVPKAEVPPSKSVVSELMELEDNSVLTEENSKIYSLETGTPLASPSLIEAGDAETLIDGETETKEAVPSEEITDTETGKDKYLTDPVPEGKPLPVELQNMQASDKAMTCFISVSCNTIIDNIDNLDPEKIELVPKDGVIFPLTEVTYYEGESVFNVLLRVMKQNKIHMEFVNTPIYNSAYIEGINNLYEFDCGELSGWMYKVNEWFPNYGCSRYQIEQGDIIEWVYTCDLGRDVGDQNFITGDGQKDE